MVKKIDELSISYLLGIMSIVFAFFTPIAGLIFGVIGLRKAKRIKSTESKKLNTIGIVLSVILIIISLVVLIYSLSTGLNTSSFPVI